MSQLAEAVAASAGGAISCTVLYPIEIIKAKLQSNTSETDKQLSFLAIAKEILAKEGPMGFLSGVHFASCSSATEKFIYFYAYSTLRKLIESNGGSMTTVKNLFVGYVCDWTHLPITLPLETLMVRIQTSDSKEGPLAIVRNVIKERGLAGLYRGLLTFLVLAAKPAVQNTIFEQVKRILLKTKKSNELVLNASEAFLVGAVARAAATVAVFPYIRAKIIMQSNSAEGSMGGVLQKIVKEQGFTSLYQGISPEISRGVLSAALMLALKERIYLFVRTFLLGRAQSLK